MMNDFAWNIFKSITITNESVEKKVSPYIYNIQGVSQKSRQV